MQVDAAANTNSLVIKGTVASEGYGTTSDYNSNSTSYTVGSATATTKYIPIKVGSISTTAVPVPSTIKPQFNFNKNSGVITATYDTSVFLDTIVESSGWISSGTNTYVTISGSNTLFLDLTSVTTTSAIISNNNFI